MSDPSLDDWRTKAEKDLRRTLDSITWRTDDGFESSPLVTAADIASLPHLRALPHLAARSSCAVHELIMDADPSDAAARARSALAAGGDEIEFCLDALAQDGVEPAPWSEDDPDAEELTGWTAPGDGGVAIHTRSEFDAAIEGLDLGAVSLWFAAGESALPILGWWIDAAHRSGTSADRLRGGVDFDPHGRLSLRQISLRDDTRAVARRCRPAAIWDEAAGIARWTREHCAEVRPLVIDGQVYHLAGGTPAVELGATLAGLVEAARELGERGVDFADLASACTVRVQVGHEILPEIAKLRALRLLWSKVAAAFGAPTAGLRLLAVTSGRHRADDFDRRANLVRMALSTFAAMVGGTDSLLVTPFDEVGDAPGALDLAREQQLLLREEGHLDRVADPTAGSPAVEKLTDAIGRRSWEILQEIEEEGGLWATMCDGSLAERLRAQESLREADVRMRRRVLVGINRFADLELGGPEADSQSEDELERDTIRRITAHEGFRSSRDARLAESCIARVRDSAPELRAQAAASPGHEHASLAELATAAWPPEGEDVEHRFVPVATTDGHEFEDLRANALSAETAGDPAPEILLLPIGEVRVARARADFARDLFEVGGFHVHDGGMFASVDDAITSISNRRPAMVVLCGADADYADLVPRIRDGIGREGPILTVAGKIPETVADVVDHSIRAGLDAAVFLTRVQRSLGILPED